MNTKERELLSSTYAAQSVDDLLTVLLAFTRLREPSERSVSRLIELGALSDERTSALARRVLCDDICPRQPSPPIDVLRLHLRSHDARERVVALEAVRASITRFGPSIALHTLAHGQCAHPDARVRSMVLDVLHLTSAAFPRANPAFDAWLEREEDLTCQRKLLVALANAIVQERTDVARARQLIEQFSRSSDPEVASTARWALERVRVG